MIAYLAEHGRYDTMNNWNRSTSYARCIKLGYIDFPDKATEDAAYDVIGSDEEWWEEAGIAMLIAEFDARNGHLWQIGTNGRSGGYMVLYEGFVEPSGYRSYCTHCGQQNCLTVLVWPEDPTSQQKLERYVVEHNSWIPGIYPTQSEVKALELPDEEVMRIVAETRRKYYDQKGGRIVASYNNRCGRCGADARVNYTKTNMRVGCWPGRGVDVDEDFESWDKHDLKARTEVVWDFDQTVNQCVKAFVEYCEGAKVVERTIMVPKTIRVVSRGTKDEA